MMLDVLIRDATVYDGSGGPARDVSVGLLGDRIAYVGPAPSGHCARAVVSAPGCILCPGFIDSHASTGLGHLLPGAADHKLRQGVTTEVIGNCGTSNAPMHPEARQHAAALGIDTPWQGMGSWLERLNDHGLPLNLATHAGHNTLRAAAGAWEADLSATEASAVSAHLAEALEAGALGLSTGLIYAPGCFAGTAEIIGLARQVAAAGGIYVSHIRDERAALSESIEEALTIGAAANLPTIISHLKAAERRNWGAIPSVLARLDDARAAGQAVTVEVYPYTAVSTRLRAFLPIAAMAEGIEGLVRWLQSPACEAAARAHLRARGTDFQTLTLISASLPGSRGQTVQALARRRGQAPEEVILDALRADPEAWVVYRCIGEEDMDAALLWPDALVCSDSWSVPVNAPRSVGDPHPRTYGAFTRFIERYGLTGRLPLAAAIRKMTGLPAQWLGLSDRGRLVAGAAADLVLLDPERVAERATYAQPRQLSEGTVQVWVNGTAMLAGEALRSVLPGRILRRSS